MTITLDVGHLTRSLSRETGKSSGGNIWGILIPIGFIVLIAIYAIWFFKFKK